MCYFLRLVAAGSKEMKRTSSSRRTMKCFPANFAGKHPSRIARRKKETFIPEYAAASFSAKANPAGRSLLGNVTFEAASAAVCVAVFR